MTEQSVESILAAMNESRERRIAARLTARDSILAANDYELFDKLLGEARTSAQQRLRKNDEPETSGSDGESSKAADGAANSGSLHRKWLHRHLAGLRARSGTSSGGGYFLGRT